MAATDVIFTADELAACAEREVRFRERVYRDRLTRGKMRPEQARREIAMMRAIAEDYRRRAEDDSLFGSRT